MIKYFGDYPGAFDSEQIGLMSKALDRAWKAVQASKASYALGDEAEQARAALAKHIIEAAKQGERDPRRLSEAARISLAEDHKG